MISLDAFEHGFKALCAAYAPKKFDPGQCVQYYDDLKTLLDEQRWTKIAAWWRRNHDQFPKISELVRLDIFRDRPQDVRRDAQEAYINDDCVIVECRSGIINMTDDDGYEFARKCPVCSRSPVPSAVKFRGNVTRFNPQEMAIRRLERQQIVREANTAKRIVREKFAESFGQFPADLSMPQAAAADCSGENPF